MRVAWEATALLGPRTGVGEFCYHAGVELAKLDGIELSAFAVSWRRRRLLVDALGARVSVRQLAMPARPLQTLWSRSDFPPVELFIGRADIVHGTNFVVPPARWAKRVVTVHDLTPLLFPEAAHRSTLVFPRLIARAIDRGVLIHTPSEFVAREVVEHFGADPSRVFAVHHGIPQLEEARDFTHAELGGFLSRTALGGAPFILGLGTIEPRKDFVSLVAAFALIASEEPDLRLVIAGQKGWGSATLDAAIAASPFQDRIQLTGYLSARERNWLLANAAVFAYPSIYEGFGLPPIEAMRFGTPVVSSDAGSLPEVLGDAAEFFPVGNSQALAKAILLLLHNDQLRQSQIERASSWIAQFSWTNSARGLTKIYHAALGG